MTGFEIGTTDGFLESQVARGVVAENIRPTEAVDELLEGLTEAEVVQWLQLMARPTDRMNHYRLCEYIINRYIQYHPQRAETLRVALSENDSTRIYGELLERHGNIPRHYY